MFEYRATISSYTTKGSVVFSFPKPYFSITFCCNNSLIAGLGVLDNNKEKFLISPLYSSGLFTFYFSIICLSTNKAL